MRARRKCPRVALQVLIVLASVLEFSRADYAYTGQCRHCEAGEYCFNDEMDECPNHSTSLQGSDNIDDCVCIDGYKPDVLHDCDPCVAGEFCSGDVVSTCAIAIGDYMTSPQQASASSDCVCMPGYYWTGTVCEACAAGSFKAGDNRLTSCSVCAAGKYSTAVAAASEAVCESCPAQSESVAGSDELIDCKCKQGSTGEDGTYCSFCLEGTYKDTVGSAPCTDCSILSNGVTSRRRLLVSLAALATHSDSVYYSTKVGSISSNDCESCASNSRILASGASGSAAEQCECFEGFTLSSGACVPCAAGTYKDAPGSAACTDCLAGKYNTLQRSSLESDCVGCPSNSETSTAGSVELADCICSAGFAGSDGTQCAECAAGSTAIGPGNTVCTLCGYGTYEQDNACVACSAGQTTTSEGAAFETQCVCAAGFGIDTSVSPAVCTACAAGTAKGEAGNVQCVDCEVGQYQASTQALSCESCPYASTNTAPAATSLHTCVCGDGFETTVHTADSVICAACTAQSFSQHGTIDITTDTGVITYATKTCAACAAGEFVRANVCTACGANSGADVALSSSGLCECEPGYTCTPHRYTVTAVSNNAAGLPQFSLQVEKTQEEAGVTQTLHMAAQEIVLPLHVPVIVDWSAVPSTLVMFGVPTAVLSEYTAPSISDVVVYTDAAKHQTTIVLKRETSVHAVGALSGFAGTPVRTDECTCISCQAGFVKLGDGNACSCETAQDGVCVKCLVDATLDHSCRQCSAGQYSESNLASTACLSCAPGSYSTVASDTCTGCTGASFTAGSGSVSADACLCNAGYYLSNELCTSCAVSFYKSTLGNQECTMCPAPLVGTLPTQTSDADCQACAATEYYAIAGVVPICAACDPLGCDCPEGYTGDGRVQCSECAQGTWKSSPGSAACTDCPAGYVGHATDRLAQASACVECTAGTYASGQVCVDCEEGKTSAAGSDDVNDCYLLAGFTLDTSGVPPSLVSVLAARGQLRSKPCAPGTYKATDGTDPCTACEDGKFTSAPGSVTCDACPENTLQLVGADQTTVVSCVCPAGYIQTASATPTVGNCQACAAGKFADTAGASECQSCVEGKYFAQAGTGQHIDYCTLCPSDSSSPAGSHLESSCVCNSGFVRTGDACHACNHNETEVNGVCTQCPSHSGHANIGSSDPTDCVCDDGYSGGFGQACTACGADVYCVAGKPYPCGEFRNTRGLGLKRTNAACICMAGYYELAGECVECEEDSYCDMNAITPCPADSVAVAATADISGCVCKAGYKAIDDADGNLESCAVCTNTEWCAGIKFQFNMQMESSVDDIADAEEITQSVADMLEGDDTVVKQVKTQLNFNVVVPSNRIILNADVLAEVGAVSDFTQRAITQQTHSMVVLDVNFANVSPLQATDAVRRSVRTVLRLQAATDEEIASWVNVTSKAATYDDPAPAPAPVTADAPAPAPAQYRRRRRNLLAVIAFSVQSSSIVHASTSDVFLPLYEACISIDVSAILQTAYRDDGLLIDKALIQQRLEVELQELSSSSSGSIRRLRRMLTTTEPSVTVESMELDTDVSLQTSSSSSQDVMSSGSIHAIEANLVHTLADSAGATAGSATTDAKVQMDVLVETSSDKVSTPSLLLVQSEDTTTKISVGAVGVTTSNSVSCATDAEVVDGACTCLAGQYCEDTSVETANVQNCVQGGTLQCADCPEDTYCEGDNEKISCNVNMITLSTASTSDTDCLCEAGFFEQSTDTCVACGVHVGAVSANAYEEYYCAENAAALRCNEFSIPNFEKAENQASAPSNCLCKPGYFRLDEFDTCKPCPRNHYCPEVTTNVGTLPNIFSCHENAITDGVGKANSAECYCEVGFKLTQDSESTSCLACLATNLCAVGFTDADIIACLPDSQPNADHTDCECKPGFKTLSRVQTQHQCSACEAGKVQTLAGQDSCDACSVGYFSENANQACVQCPTNEEALDSANAQCRCKAPYVRDDGLNCVLCDVDEYFELDTLGSATAAGTCKSCPDNSEGFSRPDAAGFDVCVCNAGYERTASPAADGSDLCVVCDDNTFEYNGVCLSCGVGATSAAGSDSAEDCECDVAGKEFLWPFYGENSQIPDCEGASEDNELTCTACEPGKFSNEKDRESLCENCAIGEYQYAAAQDHCESCGSNKNTHAVGSDHAGACVCIAGYEMQICTNLIESCGAACDACTVTAGVYDLEKSTFIGEATVQHDAATLDATTAYLQASTDDSTYTDCTMTTTTQQESKFDCGVAPQRYLKLTTAATGINAVIVSADGQHPDRSGCVDLAMACSNTAGSCDTLCPTKFLPDESTLSNPYSQLIDQSEGIRIVLKNTAFVDTVIVTSQANVNTNNLRVHVNYESNLPLDDVLTSANICTFEAQSGSEYSFNCHHRVGRTVWVYHKSGSTDSGIRINKIEVNGRVEAPEHHWFPCVACELGKAKSALSNALCTECAVGDYANTVALSTCLACSTTAVDIDITANTHKDYLNADTTEQVGSNSAKQCVCVAGKGLHGTDTTPYDTSDECLACPEGFYKDEAGNDKCSICTLSHYGDVDEPPAGDLHDSENHCIDCPTNSQRRLSSAISRSDNNDWWNVPADNIDDCECIAGTTLVGPILSATTPGACTECFDYYVKTLPGNQACNLCAANHHENIINGPQYPCVQCQLLQESNNALIHTNVWNSPIRITAASYTLSDIDTVFWARTVDDCQCNLGFYKSDADPATCLHCANGRYKDTLASDVCFDCAQGKFSKNAASGAPVNEANHVVCTTCPDYSNTVRVAVETSYNVIDTIDEASGKVLELDKPFKLSVGVEVVVDWSSHTTHPFGLSLVQTAEEQTDDGTGTGSITAPPDHIVTQTISGTKTKITLHSTQVPLYYLCNIKSHNYDGVAVQYTDNLHDSVDSCVCNEGYEFDVSGPGTCSECSKGKARSVDFEAVDLTQHNCWNGDSIDRKECLGCVPCGGNEYQDETAQATCITCPGNENGGISLNPKSDVRSCLCGPGEAGIDASTLESSSPEQITTEWDAGTYASNDAGASAVTDYAPLQCSACALGKFSVADTFIEATVTYTQHVCMDCPLNMDTDSTDGTDGTGKSVVTDCKCMPGFQPAPGVAQNPVVQCTACQHGYFKETLGNFDCVPCKAIPAQGWTDSTGATSRDECQCKAADGYIENKDFDPDA